MLFLILKIILFLAAAAILGFLFGWLITKKRYASGSQSTGFTEDDNDFSFDSEATDLSAETPNTQKLVDDTTAEVSAKYKQQIESLESKLSDYETRVSSYSQKIEDYETKLELIEADKTKLEKQMASSIMGDQDFISQSPAQDGSDAIVSKLKDENNVLQAEIEKLKSKIGYQEEDNKAEEKPNKKSGLLSVFRDKKDKEDKGSIPLPVEKEKPAEVKETKQEKPPVPQTKVEPEKNEKKAGIEFIDTTKEIPQPKQNDLDLNAPKKFEPSKPEPKLVVPQVEDIKPEPKLDTPAPKKVEPVVVQAAPKPESKPRQDTLKIETIEGIGKAIGGKLRDMNIDTTDALLGKVGRNKTMIDKISQNTSVSAEVVANWVSMADLLRIPGVDKQFAELLNVAGMTNIQSISKCNEGELHAKMLKINADTPVSPEVPELEQVKEWKAAAANTTPRIDL